MRLSLLRAKPNRTWVVGGQQKHKRIFFSMSMYLVCACVDVCDVSWRQTGPRSPRSMAVCVKTMNQHGFTCQLEGAPPGAGTENWAMSGHRPPSGHRTWKLSPISGSTCRWYLLTSWPDWHPRDPNGPRVVCSHEIDLHTTVTVALLGAHLET
jgi:hypothetical protein